MAPRYTLSTEIHFSASHALTGYEGNCANIHGHNWVVRVYYEFERLDEHGFTIDYKELKSRLAEVIMPHFDHRHLNDISTFDSINPTAENIAAEIFKLCRDRVRIEGSRLVEVELWETPADMVRYRE